MNWNARKFRGQSWNFCRTAEHIRFIDVHRVGCVGGTMETTVLGLREEQDKRNALQEAVDLAIVIIHLKGFWHQNDKPHYLSFTRELYSVLIKFCK